MFVSMHSTTEVWGGTQSLRTVGSYLNLGDPKHGKMQKFKKILQELQMF